MTLEILWDRHRRPNMIARVTSSRFDYRVHARAGKASPPRADATAGTCCCMQSEICLSEILAPAVPPRLMLSPAPIFQYCMT